MSYLSDDDGKTFYCRFLPRLLVTTTFVCWDFPWLTYETKKPFLLADLMIRALTSSTFCFL